MSRLEDIGERDAWRCWLCDEPVDPKMSVNDARGPSLDSRITKAKSKGMTPGSTDRLAHRGCNTKKGAIAAVVAWPGHLFVGDPAPIISAVERLQRKGGREIMARCPTRGDAQDAATWLTDRVARLAPDLGATADVEAGGGQFLLVLRSGA
ncbi:MAG: hypothetical protein LH616_04555 [Ilumatobacteraceae bacterium]|nr:hypothetical protein [Ilumatobacteraceae bacterium]